MNKYSISFADCDRVGITRIPLTASTNAPSALVSSLVTRVTWRKHAGWWDVITGLTHETPPTLLADICVIFWFILW